jgi:peptidoglycan/LPS O-acetylase OafA/YrhL
MDDLRSGAGMKANLRGIEGLRALAACSILALHCWGTTKPDVLIAGVRPMQLTANLLTTGVALFFALSGFLLFRPWAHAALGGTEPPSIRRYARRRVLRIAPAYLVILPLVAFVLGTATVAQGANGATIGMLTDPLDLLANATLTQDLFPATAGTGIMPAWSLAIEVVFYLSLPLLGLLAYRLVRGASGRRRQLGACAPALLLLAIGLVGKFVVAQVVPGPYGSPVTGWHYILESSFLSHADEFSFGMLVAVLQFEHLHGRIGTPSRRARIVAEVSVLLAMVLVVMMVPALRPYLAWTLASLLFASLIAVVVIPVAPAGPALLRVLEWRPIAWTGTISYSIFLWNQPIAFWLYAHGVFQSGFLWFPVNLAIDLAVCLALSWATYRWVERPAMLRRSARTALVPVPAQAP